MVYSPRIRAAVGAVRDALASVGLTRQSQRFAQHGVHKPDPDAPLVLVACSGGRDSMALAAVAGIVCASLGLRCGAIVVDHGLQPNSGEVARDAAERCTQLGLDPVAVHAVQVRESGQGVESAARQERYRALSSEAADRGAAAVLLAHTRDDQAETVLIGLLRSGGIDAVAGMPESFERDGVQFLRPFLQLSRDDTTGICQELGLTWWDDPTNGPVDGLADSPADGSIVDSSSNESISASASSTTDSDYSANTLADEAFDNSANGVLGKSADGAFDSSIDGTFDDSAVDADRTNTATAGHGHNNHNPADYSGITTMPSASASPSPGPSLLSVDYPLRSRVRHDLVPFLRQFAGSDVVTHLAEQSRFARIDKAYLDAEAEHAMTTAVNFATGEDGEYTVQTVAKNTQAAQTAQAAQTTQDVQTVQVVRGAMHAKHDTKRNAERNERNEHTVLTFRIHDMENLHMAIRLRVIAHALSKAGIPYTSRHVEAIERLISDWHGQGAVSLPRGHSASRQRHVIRVCQDGTHADCRCTGRD